MLVTVRVCVCVRVRTWARECESRQLCRVAQLAKEARETTKPRDAPEFQALMQTLQDKASMLGHKVSPWQLPPPSDIPASGFMVTEHVSHSVVQPVRVTFRGYSKPMCTWMTLRHPSLVRVLAQEVARSLWAMSTLRHKPQQVVRALCDQAQAILPRFNNQDLATSAWALGSLHCNPGNVLEAIALHAATCIDQFEPKVI